MTPATGQITSDSMPKVVTITLNGDIGSNPKISAITQTGASQDLDFLRHSMSSPSITSTVPHANGRKSPSPRASSMGRPRCQRHRHHRRHRMVRWHQLFDLNAELTAAEIDALTTDAFSITSVGGDQNGWQYSASQNLDFLRNGRNSPSPSMSSPAITPARAPPAPPKVVTITLTGTNDQPEISFITQTGDAIEADGPAQLTATGQITWDDLDANDIVTITPTYNGDIEWSDGTNSPSISLPSSRPPKSTH